MSKHFVNSVVETLRSKLLDLSGRNSLISFRHSDRARKQLRIVDTLPDRAYESVDEAKSIRLIPLPLPPFEAPDEQLREFMEALEDAKREDDAYLAGLKALGGTPSNKDLQQLELALRDRVRVKLGMKPVRRDKVMPREDYARELGIEPDYELPAVPAKRVKYARHQKEFQTLLYPDELERKLSAIHEQARLSESETGLNTLHFAFGFLEWYEDDNSSEAIFSPLTLYPVQVTREVADGEYIYSVSTREEELTENICLLERLKKDFDIAPVKLEEDERPEHYFTRFEAVIRKRRGWKVHRYATLGFFSFAKISMYNDLNSLLIGEHKPESTLTKLITGVEGDAGDEPGFAQDYEVDHPEILKKLNDLITDADSSQMSAIVDARDGKNLVIEGPPGTGKSQTITNIIASAMAEGKSILFVAEKRAALEVVKKRLDDAGLGTFCLELHSNKTRKTDVLATLEDWAKKKASRPRADFGDTLQRIDEIRQSIGNYVSVLNAPFGKTGKTLHDILWRAMRLRDEGTVIPEALNEIILPNAAELNSSDIETAKSVLNTLERHREANLAEHPTVESHPWHGLAQASHTDSESKNLIIRVKAAVSLLATLKAETDAIHDFSDILSTASADELQQLIVLLQQEKSLLEIDAHYDIASKVSDELKLVQKAINSAESAWQAESEIKATLDPDVAGGPQADDVAELLTRIAELSLEGGAPKDLPDRMSAAQKVVDDWNALNTLLHDIASRLAVDKKDLTFQEGAWLLQVALLAKKAPAEVAYCRNGEILNPDNNAPIVKFADSVSVLRDERDWLLKIFATTTYDSRSEVEAAAKILTPSTFWSNFSRPFWRAKQLFRAMARQETRLPATEMGRTLSRLIVFSDARRDLEADAKMQAILQRNFAGIETDTKNVAACAAWATEVIGAYPSYEPFAASIRKWLFEAPLAEFASLREFSNHPRHRDFSDLVSPSKDRPRRKISTEVAGHTSTLAAATQTHELSNKIGLRREFLFSQAPALKKLVAERDRNEAFLSKDSTRRALDGIHPITRDNIERLRRTVNLIERMAKLPHSDRWLDLLSKPSSREILNKNFNAILTLETPTRCATDSLTEIDALRAEKLPKLSASLTPELIKRLLSALDSPTSLPVLTDYLRAEADAEKVGAGPLLEAYKRNGLNLTDLGHVYEFIAYSSILRLAQAKYPQLNTSVSFRFDNLRTWFIEFENKLITIRRKKIASDLFGVRLTRGVSTGKASELTDLGLIQHESAKQRKHIPIRALLHRAGDVIREMKPCFMMSPLTVAQFLSPNTEFDLVIMDEASQLRPEDAIGAVMRGKQVIVVGDPKQLPPTNFFSFSDGNQPSGADEDEAVSVDEESVLDMAFRSFHPARRLRWHYRSRHESLIAFSNHSFYDRDLVVFPSPYHAKASHGITFIPVEGVYDKRRNLAEAQAVVNSVMKLMTEHPDRSIGVVAMNQEQRELLSDLIDAKVTHDPVVQDYIARWQSGLEPFFVKNLENVQGDERDIIVISTVYGKDPAGNFFQRFGPVNGPTGHRRLNVLFSRAKYQMVVHSSINPEAINTDNKSSEGLRAFKNFLIYAKTGRLDSEPYLDPNRREPDSDFEVFVMRQLERRGYKVTPQVGVAGYFIDLAVRHPHLPGEYVLGIECDGATYHSAKCARDRDKTRQEVLENLGWKIHRIWSTDWFQHTEREIAKVIAALPPGKETSR